LAMSQIVKVKVGNGVCNGRDLPVLPQVRPCRRAAVEGSHVTTMVRA